MSASLLESLRAPGPLVSVELRPPRAGLGSAQGMDVWIDMHHTISKFSRRGMLVFLTDDAVGSSEEESLTHLSGNLGGGVGLDHILPFLTTKHSFDYCKLFARRAQTLGVAGLTVVGGDTSVGPPRCLPHAEDLRNAIREDKVDLPLGGWANPHRDIARQVGFVSAPTFSADFIMTQIMSHHSVDRVVEFQAALAEAGVTVPVMYGVFYYRSSSPATLDVLGRFFPVPIAKLSEEFEEGATPEEICAKSIRTLREVGAEKIYVSNLRPRDAVSCLDKILALI